MLLSAALSVTGILMAENVQPEIVETVQDTVETEPQSLDSTIVVPMEFDCVLDEMLHSWASQYAETSDCVSSMDAPAFPDSVYIARLMSLPYQMEMPYNEKVRSFIDLYTVRRRKQMAYLLGMSDYYFPIFEEKLNAYGLPLELRNLPIIESALNPGAISHAGAAGLWQFMVLTGRMYGLEINSLVDERCDPIKSTDAACRFLRDLYGIYGDWHLVIAAYNCGPGNVNKAIRRAGGKHDYWQIYPYLPAETRGYVPIFIAANYAMNFAEEHHICPVKVNMPLMVDTILTGNRMHLEQVSAVLDLPLDELRALNPQYRKDILPGNGKNYALCLPMNYSGAFIDKEADILSYKADSLVNNRRPEIEMAQKSSTESNGSGSTVYYKVRSGNTLGGIAQKYHITVAQLKKWNHISGTTIRVGQTLKICK